MHYRSQEAKDKSMCNLKAGWNKGQKCDWVKNNPQTFKKGDAPWNVGLKVDEGTRNRLIKLGIQKGSVPWNKGLPIKPWHCKKCGGIHNSPSNCSFARIKIGLKHKGKVVSLDTRRKQSDAHNKLWDNPTYAKNQAKVIGRKPNSHELYVDAILQLNFPHEWKYVGEHDFIIEGKNPDFINCNGRKLIIEYDGFWRHLTPEGLTKKEFRKNLFSKYGYKTLFLYTKDIKTEQVLINRIKEFIEEVQFDEGA